MARIADDKSILSKTNSTRNESGELLHVIEVDFGSTDKTILQLINGTSSRGIGQR